MKPYVVCGLIILAVIIAGIYKYSEFKIYEQAYNHPAIKLIEVTKTIVKHDTVTHEKIVIQKDGTQTIDRTITDKTQEQSDTSKKEESKPILPNIAYKWFNAYGDYNILNKEYSFGAGVNLLDFSIGLAVSISPTPAPKAYVLFRF